MIVKKLLRIWTLNAEPLVVIRGEDVTVVDDGDFRATAVAEAEPRIEAKGVYLGCSMYQQVNNFVKTSQQFHKFVSDTSEMEDAFGTQVIG